MLAVVLGCFALGLVAQRALPASRRLVDPLDVVVLDVALPALILARLPGLALGADLAVPIAAAWGGVAVAAASVLIGARRFGWSRATTGALLLVTPLGNTSFLGLALVEALAGTEVQARAIAFDQLGSFLALATYGSVIAAHWGSGEGGWRPAAERLVRFPAFWAVLASFPLRAVELPVGLEDALGQVGRLVGPLAMLALGLRFRVVTSSHAPQAAAWCLTTRLLVVPATVLLAAAVVGGRSDPAWQASVLEAAMPPMVTAGVVAARAGLDEEVATTVVGVGLVLALVTVPLWYLTLG